MLQNYAPDSPEAMARVVVMMMVTDGHLDDREIRMLEKLDCFERLGISRDSFKTVATRYCADLRTLMGDAPSLSLIDVERIDRILDAVTAPEKRLAVCRQIMGVIAADGKLQDSEVAVFHHLLDRWGLDRDELGRAIEKQLIK
jgi:uncharacterized tellurite resistance protein B-like protein